jgi:hypothetical protein
MEWFDLSFDTKSIWSDVSKKRFILHIKNKSIQLGVGDCIIWDDRHEYVVITEVIGNDSTIGPYGFIYLPWRNEGRWASKAFSLRGDPRFVICYPGGTPHYGLHIPLHTIRKDEVPTLNVKELHTRITNNYIAPLRFEINKQCTLFNFKCNIVHENTYHIGNDEVQIELGIFQFETSCSKYIINIKKISGSDISFQDFILDFKITEYPLT